MASSQPQIVYFLLCIFFLIIIYARNCTSCYTSIFGFGDSLTDAGNLVQLYPHGKKPHMFFLPYGKTYFHHPTGRCSDGRLLIDLIAQHYGLPFPPPSLDARDGKNIQSGINFAVVGSRAIDAQFYEKRGIYDKVTNVSMWDQLNWFKQMLPLLCHNPLGCQEFLKRSLFLLGEFGGNDYTHALLSGKNSNDILPIIPLVTKSIASGAHELVELGAKTIMVPSVLPLGCASSYLTYFESLNEEDYDELGCLIWPNKFASYHNELLQKELHQLRELHPQVNIIYADYYNAAMQLYRAPRKYALRKNKIWGGIDKGEFRDQLRELHPQVNIIYADYYNAAMQLYRAPRKYGFSKSPLTACCGGGGPYNFNILAQCGNFPSTSCEDPNQYVNWDGYHLTEAAYGWMAKSLLEGPFTYPPIKNLCPFDANKTQLSQI